MSYETWILTPPWRARATANHSSGRRWAPVAALTLAGVVALGATFAEQSDSNVRRLAKGETPQSARASDMDWLAGRWRGSGLGGECEEVWMPAAAGSMVGAFRLIKEDEVQFYEFLTIMEVDDSVVLRVKHFDNTMVGWEERSESVDFPLVAWSEGEAFFSGLTIRRQEDRLEMFLAMRNSDGKSWEERFSFERME